MDFSSIKNIIFDLGGVIINLDFEKTYQAFAALGSTRNTILSKLENSRLFDLHGNGDITDQAFRNDIKKTLHLEVSDEVVDQAYNALLCDIPIERIELLQSLSQKYRLFLLSNTNQIHIDKVNEILKSTCQVNLLDDLFEKIYYSHNMKLSKPDLRIYEKVLQDNNLLAEETVFIDDNLSNVEGANRAGIKGIHIKEPQTILDIFSYARK